MLTDRLVTTFKYMCFDDETFTYYFSFIFSSSKEFPSISMGVYTSNQAYSSYFGPERLYLAIVWIIYDSKNCNRGWILGAPSRARRIFRVPYRTWVSGNQSSLKSVFSYDNQIMYCFLFKVAAMPFIFWIQFILITWRFWTYIHDKSNMMNVIIETKNGFFFVLLCIS